MVIITALFQNQRDRNNQFENLVQPHVNAMYRMAYRWTQNRDDAEDVVQETLTKLVNRTEEIEAVEKLRPWLIKVLYRCFVDFHRKRTGTMNNNETSWRADVSAIDELVSHVPDESDEYQRLDMQRTLLSGLQGLNEDQRNVVLLHDTEGYTADEIASILEISIGTVKSRLHRARENLKKLLKDGTI